MRASFHQGGVKAVLLRRWQGAGAHRSRAKNAKTACQRLKGCESCSGLKATDRLVSGHGAKMSTREILRARFWLHGLGSARFEESQSEARREANARRSPIERGSPQW